MTLSKKTSVEPVSRLFLEQLCMFSMSLEMFFLIGAFLEFEGDDHLWFAGLSWAFGAYIAAIYFPQSQGVPMAVVVDALSSSSSSADDRLAS